MAFSYLIAKIRLEPRVWHSINLCYCTRDITGQNKLGKWMAISLYSLVASLQRNLIWYGLAMYVCRQ